MTEKRLVQLGDKVSDIITTMTGIAVARTTWLHGCDRISVQPPATEGSPVPQTEIFDEQRITVVQAGLCHPAEYERPELLPLGSEVRDTISGFTGLLVGISEWFGGSVNYIVEPTVLKDGKPVACEAFERTRVELVAKKEIPVAPEAQNKRKGGPAPRGEAALTRR